ncbi:MAG: flagellar motor stator protein MotA [Acidobacteriota bacterium]
MLVIVGLIVVFVSVIGGFLIMQGPLHVLIQPSEIIVIGGACLGAMVVGAPGKMLRLVLQKLPSAFKGSPYSKDSYLELLRIQYEIYVNVKKGSWLAIEGDVNSPDTSTIFSKYPGFLNNHHVREFFCDAMVLLVNGAAQVEEIEQAMEAEIETHHEESTIVPGILTKASDSLPGLGIVAAVLGIVVTMQHIDGPPEEIGHHVAAALVGTFLGLLLSYGMLAPVATNLEKLAQDESKYYSCIKAGLIAFANGAAPATAVEFARRTIFSFDRPTSAELDKQLREIKPR